MSDSGQAGKTGQPDTTGNGGAMPQAQAQEDQQSFVVETPASQAGGSLGPTGAGGTDATETGSLSQAAPTPSATPAAATTSTPNATSAPAQQAGQRDIVRSIHYRLSYIVQNPERGPQGAIVLLHDLPGGAFVWQSILPQIAATGKAVYAFDMLGYGDSDHPWPSDTTIWGHADCLLYAFQTLGLTDITLVGVGLGGAVAQVLATRLYREEVARLALINTYAYLDAYAPNWPLPDMEKHQDPEASHTMKLDAVMNELRQTVPLGAAKGLNKDRLTMYVNEWNSEVGKHMLLQHVRLMLPDYINAVASDVTKLAIPVLVVWGEQDQVTPLSLGQRLARETATAQLETLPGVGHLALDDAPAQVARLIADFAVAQQPATAGAAGR